MNNNIFIKKKNSIKWVFREKCIIYTYTHIYMYNVYINNNKKIKIIHKIICHNVKKRIQSMGDYILQMSSVQWLILVK